MCVTDLMKDIIIEVYDVCVCVCARARARKYKIQNTNAK